MSISDSDFEILLRDSLIQAAAEDYFSDIPDDAELESLIMPSKRFERRMSRLINNPVAYVKGLRRPMYKRVLRTTAMIVLTLSVAFGAVMLHPEARAKVLEVITTWYEDHTRYEFEDRSGSEWGFECTLGYIPEGFKLEFEMVDELSAYYRYSSDNDDFNVDISAYSGALYIDNEHSEFYKMEIDGKMADIYETNDEEYSSHVILYDDEKRISIICAGSINVDELVKIIQSIEIK